MTERSMTTTPSQLLAAAVDNNADIEKLTKLMELAERWEANQARKEFVKAMAAFRAEAITVYKNKEVSFQNTSYSHATLDAIIEAASPYLSKHGLSHHWETSQADGSITVACVLTHVGGHSQRTPLSAPADQSGKKNSIQAIGSTVSYLERYTFLAATGLAVKDMDNDAQVDIVSVSTEQVERLHALIEETGTKLPKFLQWAKVEDLEHLPEKNFATAERFLMKKLEKKGE